ncbi:thiol-disulfide oxidoreductase DCC family protein [Roseibium sp.]|uniref:thiol-disulfide oxidoreductase DCC family protein n=1 Tax=Roseibium sp. TaxID=1936156 RepID=UPI003B528FD4
MNMRANTLTDKFVNNDVGFDDDIVVVFDSDCILCSHWVRFILRHEASENVRFASSRKTFGKALADRFDFKPEDLNLTYLVVRRGQALTKSDATVILLGELKRPWSWFCVLRFIPRVIRDGIYDIVARNRLRWFGMKKDCLLPTPEQRHRFLD